jgi:tetratricopeptide (TPR) repeat protein
MARHRLDEAIAEVKRAQKLDPLNPQAQQHIAMYFIRKKDYDRAIQENRKAIELEPNSSLFHGALAQTYHDAGRYTEALAEARRAYELSGEPLNPSQIAHMLAHLGKTDEAEKIIEEVTEGGKTSVGSSYSIAKTYAVLKRKEETLKWLEYAYEVRNNGVGNSVFGISEEEDFDWLRSGVSGFLCEGFPVQMGNRPSNCIASC